MPYIYDEFDQRLLTERVAQFRDQTRRFLTGELSEDEFRPLRLKNGLYIQLHAPMLRVAIPYGELSSRQLRTLADVARRYDRGYGHFSTRQNIQFNWVKLPEVPDLLDELATVSMHAIQTSGNCVRNVTSDQFAGIAPDEIVDPRPWCELLRQWSTFHPEFAWLPRKFKIAVNGAREDRAAIRFHDIGLDVYRDEHGETVFRVWVGGGMGRTPMLGVVIREALPWQELLNYCDAILRVYNRHGRRDNLYKSRIKILVKSLGTAEFARQVEQEWQRIAGDCNRLTVAERDRVAAHFVAPAYPAQPADDSLFQAHRKNSLPFSRWVERNVHAHRQQGYSAVTISLKHPGQPPGDATASQMDAIADLADRYSLGETRVTHEQNLVLPHVPRHQLWALWQELRALKLASPTVGLLADIICCPGKDFCSLANARSIPVAEAIQNEFSDLDELHELGPISLNMSGCMNACGHHHAGHIGILGVDKDGSEWYQISIGGNQGQQAAIGKVIGPSLDAEQVPQAIRPLLEAYLAQREGDELFVDTVRRLGIEPFKRAVYGEAERTRRAAHA